MSINQYKHTSCSIGKKGERHGTILKRGGALLAVFILLGVWACQKSPDDLTIQNKAEEDLAKAVAAADEPAITAPTASEAPDVNAGLFKETYHLTERVSNDAGTIVLDIDADIVPIGIEKIPVAVVEPYDMTNEEASRMANAFFDGRRKDDSGQPLALHVEGRGDLYKKIDIGRNYSGSIIYSDVICYQYFGCLTFREMSPRQRDLMENMVSAVDADDTSDGFLSAKRTAQDFIEAAGMADSISLGGVYLSKDTIGDVIVSDEDIYVFCYERIVGEGVIAHTFYSGGVSDNESQKPFHYEKIEVWVNGPEVVQFYWYSPTKVAEIIEENAKVQIDDKQAVDLIKKQLFTQYAGVKDELNIEVERIELILFRVKDEDTGRYLVVPAWTGYGALFEKRSEGGYRNLFGGQEQRHKQMVTINALDGSAIDMDRTY